MTSNKTYRPTTTAGRLGWVTEECGEVLAAVGKTQRWGLWSVNPELPAERQESNGDWILRELQDLKKATACLEDDLRALGFTGGTEKRGGSEAQRDELLTLARKLVELDEWVASTMTSSAKGMTVDVSWTGELANIIAEAKLALEKAQ